MIAIDIYASRIEIYPYYPTEKDPIIDQCSTKYDINTHKKYKIGCMYIEEESKLIAMRGLNINWVCQSTGSYPSWHRAQPCDKMKGGYKMTVRPRNKDQMQAIKFLLSYGEYMNLGKYSQRSLNTEPGFGKTFCSIAAALERGKRTIIIVHNSNVMDVWLETIKSLTTIPKERVLILQGTENMKKLMEADIDADVILSLHQTLSAFLNAVGYNELRKFMNHLKCGTKIIDEAHLFFKNTIQIDFCSDIEQNFYLTGTMSRSDPIEIGLFHRYFSAAPSFGNDLEKTRNVVYTFLTYDSSPSMDDQVYITTKRGPNASKFIDYAIKRDPNQMIIGVMFRAIERCKEHQGKILILIPKISVIEYVCSLVQQRYPQDIVRGIHSKKSKEENKEAKNSATIIISTISGSGTGADIKDLRSMIIMELYSSPITATQVPNRLRPWTNGKDSYCYEISDCGFEPICAQVRRKTPALKKCCKSVKTEFVKL